MEILFHVSTRDGARILLSLARACVRRGRRFACFFTHEGVTGLLEEEMRVVLAASARAVVCEESWRRFCPGLPCPVEGGSQTTNSALMGETWRVVSL